MIYIPIKVKEISSGIKIFIYSYNNFYEKWKLSDVIYNRVNDFNEYFIKYNGDIDYYGLFKCVFEWGTETEYGDDI